MIPNFLIIGAEKSGTTWLYDRLRRHPDIFMPGVKEIHFFNRENSNLKPRRNYEQHDETWYRNHFRQRSGEQAIGEATPMYLCDEAAPNRIRHHLPDVKLIACLRYPTDRAYSHYWMAKGKNHVRLDFEEVVRQQDPRFVERGRYEWQLKHYLDLFSRDQLLVLVHEEVFDSPSGSLKRICAFLDVDENFFQGQSWIKEKVHPSSTERSVFLHRTIGTVAKWMRAREGFRQMLDFLKEVGVAQWVKQMNKKPRDYPEIPDDLRRELDEYYTPTVQQVERVLGRRIEAWRKRSTTLVPEPIE